MTKTKSTPPTAHATTSFTADAWSQCGLPSSVVKACQGRQRVDDEWWGLIDEITASIDGGVRLVVLYGKAGSGKTQTAAHIARIASDRGLTIGYIASIDLLLSFRAATRSTKRPESAVMEEFTRPDLLIIDNVRMPESDRWEDELAWHLVNKRWDAELTTIVTSAAAPRDRFTCYVRDHLGHRAQAHSVIFSVPPAMRMAPRRSGPAIAKGG